jgi:hypothetical protein
MQIGKSRLARLDNPWPKRHRTGLQGFIENPLRDIKAAEPKREKRQNDA